MADITVTFSDGKQHRYQNAPDTLSATDVYDRAAKDFPGLSISKLDRVAGTAPTDQGVARLRARGYAPMPGDPDFTAASKDPALREPVSPEPTRDQQSPPLGLSDKQRAWLQQQGVFRTPERGGPVRALNEIVIEPAAILADLAGRGLGKVGEGYQTAADALIRAGVPRDLVALPEAFMGSPAGLAGAGGLVRPIAAQTGVLAPAIRTAQTIEDVAERAGGVAGRAATAPVRATKAVVNPASLAGKIGEATPITQRGETIGTAIEKQLEAHLAARRGAAAKAFGKYFEEGEPVEQDILRSFREGLGNIKALGGETVLGGRSLTVDEIKFLDQIEKRVAGNPGIFALEKERRFLNDVASGLKPEGYDAIPQQLAQNLSNLLTTEISGRVPAAEEAWKIYAEASAPINRYAKSIGAKVTERANDFLPEVPKTDRAKLPPAFFDTATTAKDLKALSGSEELAEQAARQHVASELSGIKDPTRVEDYIRKNSLQPKDWLNEFPGVKADLERLAAQLRWTSRARQAGKVGLGLAGLRALGVPLP